MRGLKPKNEYGYETLRKVASFTDAWIETFNPEFDHIGYQSHLLQMRGLKRYDALNMPEYLGSHLLQMRGLKLMRLKLLPKWLMSHLLQMRGLKLDITNFIKNVCVASFTDAWIETI